jgi:hypothetical protein
LLHRIRYQQDRLVCPIETDVGRIDSTTRQLSARQQARDTAEKHTAADTGTEHDGWLPQSVRRENIWLELASVKG